MITQTFDLETFKYVAKLAVGHKPKTSKYVIKGTGSCKVQDERYGFYTSKIFGEISYCFDLNFGHWSTDRKEAFNQASQYGALALIK